MDKKDEKYICNKANEIVMAMVKLIDEEAEKNCIKSLNKNEYKKDLFITILASQLAGFIHQEDDSALLSDFQESVNDYLFQNKTLKSISIKNEGELL